MNPSMNHVSARLEEDLAALPDVRELQHREKALGAEVGHVFWCIILLGFVNHLTSSDL